jgi:hypothetical protein
MILRGKKLQGPNIEVIVLPRDDGDLIFKAQAILDFKDFERLCPEPKIPEVMKRGEGIVQNPEDPFYKKELEQYRQKQMNWMVVNSLRATEGLEWEQVKFEDSGTWHLYEEELRQSGFGQFEINKIIKGVWAANCLDEEKLQQARKRFLAGNQELPKASLSQTGEHTNTQSGEPVNGSV